MSMIAANKKRKFISFIIFFTLVVISVLVIIIVISNKGNTLQKHTFQSEDTHFTVRIPKEWTVIDQYRGPNVEGIELSPDEGIKLLLDGNEDNYISIYSQYGTLNPVRDDYDKENFSTNQGITGTLYKDKDDQMYWFLILNQNIAPGFYGAVISFKDREIFHEKEQQIIDILKSIEIYKP